MTRPCSGCGLRSCEGECFIEDRPTPTYAEFNELCERILRERVERELKRTMELQRKRA